MSSPEAAAVGELPGAAVVERGAGGEGWSGDGRSSLETASGGWPPRRCLPSPGRTSGLTHTANPETPAPGPPSPRRRRHGVLRKGDGEGRHGHSAGEALSSPYPSAYRTGEKPRSLSPRHERRGGDAVAASFLRRPRCTIPASQEEGRCLRSLPPPSLPFSSDLWPKSAASTENLPLRRLRNPMSPSSNPAPPPPPYAGPTCGVRKKSRPPGGRPRGAEVSDLRRQTYGDTDRGNSCSRSGCGWSGGGGSEDASFCAAASASRRPRRHGAQTPGPPSHGCLAHLMVSRLSPPRRRLCHSPLAISGSGSGRSSRGTQRPLALFLLSRLVSCGFMVARLVSSASGSLAGGVSAC